MLNKIKENKFLKILITVIRTLSMVLLILLIAITAFQRITKHNFAIGGIRVFTIISESMLPEYEIGDMIISIETPAEDIKVGDNVVYNGLVDDFKGKVVSHKVVSKDKTKDGYTFITKGTNNTVEDPEINESQIMGKVVYKTVFLSFISKIINNTTAFYLLIFITFVTLVFFEIVDVAEERRREKEED